MQEFLIVKGARQHNLKNITVEIPRNKMVVITGLSGREKAAWPLIRFTPKASVAMWNPCRPMPASSCR